MFSPESTSQTSIKIKNLEAENIDIAKIQGQEHMENIVNSLAFIFRKNIPFKLIKVSNNIQPLEIKTYADATLPCQFNKSLIHEFEKNLNLSNKNKNIKWIFELMNREEPYSWINMYRIYEVIFHDTNGRKSKIIDRKKAERFTRTANNPGYRHTGKNARHGFSKHKLGDDPMSHKEAKNFINNLIKEYIKLKS